MKQTITIVAAMVFAWAFTGCGSTEVANSADVNQDKIYQRYTVNIDAEYGTSQATAQLRFGGSLGTTLMLTEPSQVTCNGAKMSGETAFLQGFVYSMNVDASLGDYEFVFTNTEETSYTNAIHIEAISLANVPAEVNASAGWEVTWNGAPVGNNETVTIHLSGEGFTCSESTSIQGATSIMFNSNEYPNMKGGNYEIYLERWVETSCAEAADEGGAISATYSSEHKSTKITVGAQVTAAL